MTLKYHLERTTMGEDWDRLAAASPTGTVFASSAYLAALRCRWSVYHCMRRQEVRGGLLVTESENGEDAVLHPFVVYAGALLPPPAHAQNHVQMLSDHFDMLQTMAELLPGMYRKVGLALAPGVADIRPFLWYRYGEPGPHYVPDVRYTAYVDISGLRQGQNPDETDLFARCAAARRQEVRYARKKGVVTEEVGLSAQFTEYYALTMQRQGLEVDPETLEDMRLLIEGLMAAGRARMFASRTAEGEYGSMAVMALDSRRAYYLFGANDPARRDTHCGSAVLWDAFCALAESGVAEVDLEGVNSPKRGWFKLSYGATLTTYYELALQE